MKSRNVIVSLLLVLFLVAAGGAWWLFMSIDGLVKQAIERWGPEITGVAVRVDGVRIQATEGRGTIRGLLVGSPPGYSAPHALTLGEISMTIDPASITKDAVVIRELVLIAPDVVYERGPGGDNMKVIQGNVDAWVAKSVGAAGKKDAGPGKKFIIDKLVVKDGKAHFGTTLSMPIPDLTLHDIGKKSKGASAGEVVKQVWSALLGNVSNLASRVGGAIKEGAKGAIEGVKGLFK